MPWKSEIIRGVESSMEQMSAPSSAAPAFAPILAGGLEFIENLPPKTNVPSGAVLFEQGQCPDAIHLVHTGLVKLIYLSSDGREMTLGLRSIGWYAGSVSVLLNAQSVYSVQTVTPCVVSRIPAHEFSLKLMQNAKMMRHFLTVLCHEVVSQAGAQAQVMSSSAEDRLTHFMRERNMKHPKWKTLDPLPMLKQMELAQLLSITPEHLSRLLHKRHAAQNNREHCTKTA